MGRGVSLGSHPLAAPVRAVADPWVALSAIAAHTQRVRLGPLVTPLARRRVHKLARETATLDHLSRGRLTFGVGLGSSGNGELERFGEAVEPRERARLNAWRNGRELVGRASLFDQHRKFIARPLNDAS
jgi:alkanesulfonate monooxygenase SsuD/methylene tetrahydromethanopterin reductase-like flavin-dependent oxidoreductase (luciferase family)